MSELKVWLDDVRDAPEGWIHCKTYNHFSRMVDRNWEYINTISLDHDLGGTKTGYHAAMLIYQMMQQHPRPMPIVLCHSMNPDGRKKINGVIERMKVME